MSISNKAWIKKYADYFKWMDKYNPLGEIENSNLLEEYCKGDWERVWSICNSGEGDGKYYIVSGVCGVNVSNYIITEFPCKEEDEDIVVLYPTD